MQKLALLVTLALAGNACGFEFRCRFVERVGNTETVIPANTIATLPGVSHQIRIQFGVFDDDLGPAPAGGFVGWNIGIIHVNGFIPNSQDRRTPGRLAPFNYAQFPSSNGAPPPPTLDGPDAPDFDFQTITDIDATLGTQSPMWQCVNGQDPGQPPPVIRGLNTYVSVYEITSTPAADFHNYSIAFDGDVIAATEWRPVDAPTPPDCNTGAPGSVIYGPLATPPQHLYRELSIVNVPSTPALGVLGIASFATLRRTRRGARRS